MSCFTGTPLVRLIYSSYRRIESCSNLICLSPRSFHISRILIGLQHPSEKHFLPIHIPKVLLKNSSCVPETEINGPGPYSEYYGCPNIVDALGLM